MQTTAIIMTRRQGESGYAHDGRQEWMGFSIYYGQTKEGRYMDKVIKAIVIGILTVIVTALSQDDGEN